jgi:eukaryotic-like serine/threonine-protein kinase
MVEPRRPSGSITVLNDPLAVLPTTLAGQWLVQQHLGQGGMANVYLARDLKHGRDVAIKVLRPEVASAVGSERFLREIAIAAHLNHAHILPLFDSAEVDGHVLFVMPYVAGESLRDRIRRAGPLPVREAVDIARQVASALDYAHAHGVVHRDIKPENILLQAGQAVVADFGIARAIDAAAAGGQVLTETGLVLGTPHYMSPEQITGDVIGPASDVYSLGCVLFEMLTGSPPFAGSTGQSLLGRHALEAPPSPRPRRSDVSRDLEAVVVTALAKRPEDRFASAGQLGDALSGSVPAPRLRRAGSRRLPVALAVLVLGSAAGWWLQRLGAGERTAKVAVLYLDNLSPDSADQYIADGITEETIGRLSRLTRITVPSRGMVRRFRGRSDEEPGRIGRLLGADYLVGGTLARSTSGLRVRLELVKASDGAQVWGASYDLAVADVLAIEDSIAQAVATEVIGRLAPAERAVLTAKPTENREAYDHYLKGNFYLARRTSAADGHLALKEYQAALALEPRFAKALGRLGVVYAIFANWPWEYPGLGTDSLVARGLAAANRAIAFDSASPDGWLARGFLLTPSHADDDGARSFAVSPAVTPFRAHCWSGVVNCRDSAIASLARATRLDPRDAEIWYQYGRMVRGAVGDSAILRSLALEPDRPVTAWLLGVRYLGQRRFDLAVTMLDSAITLGRRDISVYGLRMEARLARGDIRGAQADLAVIRGLAGEDSVASAFAALLQIAIDARRGHSASARVRVDSLWRAFEQSRTTRPSITTYMAAGLIAAGQVDRALDLLERLGGAATYLGQLRSTLWDPARTHPRFRRIETRMSAY